MLRIQGVWGAVVLLGTWGRIHSLAFSSFWELPAFLGPGSLPLTSEPGCMVSSALSLALTSHVSLISILRWHWVHCMMQGGLPTQGPEPNHICKVPFCNLREHPPEFWGEDMGSRGAVLILSTAFLLWNKNPPYSVSPYLFITCLKAPLEDFQTSHSHSSGFFLPPWWWSKDSRHQQCPFRPHWVVTYLLL